MLTREASRAGTNPPLFASTTISAASSARSASRTSRLGTSRCRAIGPAPTGEERLIFTSARKTRATKTSRASAAMRSGDRSSDFREASSAYAKRQPDRQMSHEM